MIITLFGQPCSGKTTLAQELQKKLFIEQGKSYPVVDGDEIRNIFKNNDYSREGRLRNLQRISDIGIFLSRQYDLTIISAVYPYKEARDYLENTNEFNNIWVYLYYNGERGREDFWANDFEIPIKIKENTITINTSQYDVQQSMEKIFSFYREISNSSRRS